MEEKAETHTESGAQGSWQEQTSASFSKIFFSSCALSEGLLFAMRLNVVAHGLVSSLSLYPFFSFFLFPNHQLISVELRVGVESAPTNTS